MVFRAEKAASLAAVAALAAAAPARAEDAVDSAVSQLVGAIQAAGAAAKVGLETVDAGLAVVKQVGALAYRRCIRSFCRAARCTPGVCGPAGPLSDASATAVNGHSEPLHTTGSG